MVTSCCAYGCSEKYVKGGAVTFHCFPKNEARKKLWEIKIRRENFKATKHSRVCSKHFTADSFDTNKFGGTWLKKDAIPTIFNFPDHFQKKKIVKKRKIVKANASDLISTNSSQPGPSKQKYYLGDFIVNDVSSPSKTKKVFNLAKQRVKLKNNLIPKMSRKNKTLQKRVSTLQEIWQTIKKKALISNSASNILEMALPPRESAKYISQHANHVSILNAGIEKAAEMVMKGFEMEKFSTKSWKENELNPQDCNDPFIIDWIFLVDTLNFSFWAEEGKEYTVTYHGKAYTGYWSLCAAVNRAIEEGCLISSPSIYSCLSYDGFKHIFRSDSDNEMPMLAERYEILIDTGKCLVEKFGGSFKEVVNLSQKSAKNLLKLVLEHFPSYRDVAIYGNKEVSFYKRAQILIGDIWACFEGKASGEFEDIDTLTIFADYRVPQVLVHIGALKYSQELLKMLESGKELKNGDEEEMEIRGCTIWAVELITEHIKMMQKEGKVDKDILFNSVLVDHYLWEYRRKHAEEMKSTPFHKVRCIYY